MPMARSDRRVCCLSPVATGGYAAFDAVEAVKQFPETIGNVVLRPERRQRAQKVHRCLRAELAPDAGRQPFTSFVIVGGAILTVAVVAGRHLKILCRFRNSSSRRMVPPSQHL